MDFNSPSSFQRGLAHNRLIIMIVRFYFYHNCLGLGPAAVIWSEQDILSEQDRHTNDIIPGAVDADITTTLQQISKAVRRKFQKFLEYKNRTEAMEAFENLKMSAQSRLIRSSLHSFSGLKMEHI